LFFEQILVATFTSSIPVQLDINSSSPGDSTIINGQDITSKQNAEHAYSRDFVRAYLDPIDRSKYYIRYTSAAGKVKFVQNTCPNNNVFNSINEKCTSEDEGINNPPKLSYIQGKKCNGFLGYYCENGKYTYCTEDNLKIVRRKRCPGRVPCRVCKSNPCI
jgi:hypothetical protein